MQQMRKYYTAGLLIVFVLSGCSSVSQFGSENYIADLENQQYCIEVRSDCVSFSLIGPSYRESWIADSFDMKKQYYSWNASELIALLLNPPDNSYTPEDLGGRQYRLPPTFATHMVWDVLAMEYFTLYGDDDRFTTLLDQRPQPRRFSVSE